VEQDPIVIRPATAADAAAIGAVYDEGIADGNATFATGPHPADERRRWLEARAANAPVFVAVRGGTHLGWSALAPLSRRPWYHGVAEYTAYVARSARGAGVGGALLGHLVRAAPGYGYWKLVGMILSDNGPGLALAARHGFQVVGTYHAHARLDGRWRDVTLVERHLEVPPPPGAPG
jgi:phosphinothricin acetyltransferase